MDLHRYGDRTISVVRKYFVWPKEKKVPGCKYINSPTGPYYLGNTGTSLGLFITNDERSRRPFGKHGVVYMGGILHPEKELYYITTGDGGVIHEYKLNDKDNIPELLSEYPVKGAHCIVGIAHLPQYNSFAVLDSVACRITIEQCGTQQQVINKVEGGEQILGNPWNVVAGVSDVESVIISDRGDEDIPQSVACVELHPPRIRWREWINDPWNLWCVDGLIFVGSSSASEKGLLVLSAHDGKLLGRLDSEGTPNGINKDADGNVLIITYQRDK